MLINIGRVTWASAKKIFRGGSKIKTAFLFLDLSVLSQHYFVLPNTGGEHVFLLPPIIARRPWRVNLIASSKQAINNSKM